MKRQGRKLVPENADANISVGRPTKLKGMALSRALSKYEVIPSQADMDSLIVQGKPISGFKDNLTLEYFLRSILRIALTASKPYDRMEAFTRCAKLIGLLDQERARPKQGINVQFNTYTPPDAELGKPIIPVSDTRVPDPVGPNTSQ